MDDSKDKKPKRTARARPPTSYSAPQRGADEAGSTRPADPRICRVCGERVLDMKYHVQREHPRGRDDVQVHLDDGTADALREMSSLLDEAKDSVFKEPLRAIALIERGREWIAWTRDRTKSRPSPRLPSTGAGTARMAKDDPHRHDMRGVRPTRST